MCSFAGFCNLNYDISTQKNIKILKILNNTLSHGVSDEENIYVSSHVNLVHRKSNIIITDNAKQPMICKYEDNTYTIVYNGQLYNAKDIRNELINFGYEFNRL